ncbi:hypothetical protein [Enterococcus faecium]|uniref:hypothetical protein n=1 Tax=Enterococcus faecium TaxID=1352 RepID=UPI0016210C01|nr:hypothetical protein [Enterococcus faecium]MCV3117380.1 hypothetical protein [Enterococcus faecium]MDQ8291615.1 hypothetical protein [Enterococcus faecium]MDT2271362.1 hypothetical protein [Enterococcus faecium]
MLTNEQRAHDLAVASLPFLREITEQEIRKGNDQRFDLYLDYKKMYDLFLESLNRDFT